MADHQLCNRTPDDILTELDDAFSVRSFDLEIPEGRRLMWDVINSVRDSYALALRGLESMGCGLDADQIVEIEQTVEDYLVNNWGDD